MDFLLSPIPSGFPIDKRNIFKKNSSLPLWRHILRLIFESHFFIHRKPVFSPDSSWKIATTTVSSVFALSDAEPNKEHGETLRNPGFSLYNLKKDPFETRNMGTGGSEKKFTKVYMDLINDIQSYVAEEIQKGIQYPITGKFKGKLVSRIMKKLPAEKKTDHYFETGRLQLFDE